MDSEFLLEKLDALRENLTGLKEAKNRAKENSARRYVDQVKYLMSGISFQVTNIGSKLISMNQGKTFNHIILESPMNVRDVFVKLGEVEIIPGKIVPYLKKLLTISSADNLEIDIVSKIINSVEEYIFYVKAFLEGTELTETEEEDVEIIREKKEKGKKVISKKEEEGEKDNPIAL